MRVFDISADGAWLVYDDVQADRATSSFLTELPAATNRRLIVSGGTTPRFSRDGSEIFYLRGANVGGVRQGLFMSVAMTSRPALSLGVPTRILDDSAPDAPSLSGYDVSADGKRFLMWKRATTASSATRVVVLQNWIK